jgi:hypothetical protein
MPAETPYEKFAVAYIELVESTNPAFAAACLRNIAVIAGIAKERKRGRPSRDLSQLAAIYAHTTDLKKQVANGNQARMLRKARAKRVAEHHCAIKGLMREFGMTEEEAEEHLERAIILTLMLEQVCGLRNGGVLVRGPKSPDWSAIPGLEGGLKSSE